ncbi:hypothetical protein HBH46_160650 [Parastagonospora nodorum]|nr:hypothetical protein HBH46_160650 [Parastagonospora nodorum]KAH5031183.1 hypothetical protein HBI74_087520 [Parastagonospora nodorum]KAH5076378.1 hypothetical protein HBH95_121500 [Parastagonospora nodorum]KAH5473484.1 hypothetical protein HBI28_120930 [Parastagonospora nodorum]KAH5626211.1 hypothetical protein HBI22_152610 [Parastagonospora nodorum]
MGPEGSLAYRTFASVLQILEDYEQLLQRTTVKHCLRSGTNPRFRFELDYFRHFKMVFELFQVREARPENAYYPSEAAFWARDKWCPGLGLRSHPVLRRSLYRWCRVLVDRDCADERDKVYAALGPPESYLDIAPNYNLSLLKCARILRIKACWPGTLPFFMMQMSLVSAPLKALIHHSFRHYSKGLSNTGPTPWWL